jgi:hypothetical protein
MENKIKNFKDLKIWQKSNDSGLDKMSLIVHCSAIRKH